MVGEGGAFPFYVLSFFSFWRVPACGFAHTVWPQPSTYWKGGGWHTANCCIFNCQAAAPRHTVTQSQSYTHIKLHPSHPYTLRKRKPRKSPTSQTRDLAVANQNQPSKPACARPFLHISSTTLQYHNTGLDIFKITTRHTSHTPPPSSP